MKQFSEAGLPDIILRALSSLQYKEPTPVQAQAIPVALKGGDIIATAQTGTGKTAAFCVPALEFLLRSPTATALVLIPTRELAVQIDTFWKQLTRECRNMHSVCIIGGNSFSAQTRDIRRGPALLIATPGRLVDHLNQRTLRLSNVGILVLDEADRMLDMGFEPQLSEILRQLPAKRQTMMFSATWDSRVDQLSKRYLKTPMRIAVGQVSQAALSVQQSLIATTNKDKNEALLDQINASQGSMLVFARTQSRTDRLTKYLRGYGVNVQCLHGGRTQGQRNSALAAFRTGQVRVLIATDIASRGIDVLRIEHVVNFDLPRDPEDYVHRIGRTGRAGLLGKAISFITPDDRSQWKVIARLLQKTGSAVPNMPLKATSQHSRPPQPKAQQRNSHHS